MIYVTGDCHADYKRFNTKNFPEQKEMTKDDYVIICGDFGYWLPSNEREYNMKMLEQRSFTTLFVDGNHEDFDELNSLPVEEWHGGKVHKIRPSVIHLMRGQYYEDVDGISIFSFGGATSHDIGGGIFHVKDLDKCIRRGYTTSKDIVPEELNDKELADFHYLPYRIENFSWWKDEVPSEEEYEEGIHNLELHGNKVDFVFSHDGPQSVVSLYSQGTIKSDTTRRYLENIHQQIYGNYKYWFFGHHHDNANITSKDILLYEQIIQIN